MMMIGEGNSKQSATGNSNAQADQNSVANVNNPAFSPTLNLNFNSPVAPYAPSRDNDTNIIVPSMPRIIRHIPSRNTDFIGRQETLTSLYDTFIIGKATAQAISGMGGIGKTQIALAYAYEHRNDYQVILWTMADRYETLVSDFVTIAGLLELPEKNAHEQSLTVNAVKSWLASHKSWLLIFDNADNATIVRNFIPSVYEGHILLTTRAASFPPKIARTVEIKPMTSEEGATFLLHRVNILKPGAPLETINATDLNDAKTISNMMDGLPLALEQAGAYIDEMGCTLENYLKLYKSRHTKLLSWHGEAPDSDQKTVATTWSLSFEKVKQNNRAASELLEFFSFLHPDTIYDEIITIAAPFLSSSIQAIASDLFELTNTVGELLKYSLIRRRPDTPAISIHRLVQTVIKDGMDTTKQLNWAEKTVKAINQALPDPNFETWPQYQRYLSHAQVCIELIQQWNMTSLEAARLLNITGKYLCERANYTEAEHLLNKALELRERELGDDHPDVADTLNCLVELYRRQGRYIQALPLCQRALTIQEKGVDTNNVNLASSLNNLARLHHHLRKDAEAEQLYQRALTIRRQILSDNHPDVAESLNDLAALYSLMNKEEKAKELFQQALTMRKQILGELHPDVALSLNNLAGCYGEQGKHTQAEELLQQALTMRKQVLGELHPDVATSLNNLASCYREQGKHAAATQAYRQAQEIFVEIFGKDHYREANCLEGLAVLYFRQQEFIRSKQIFTQTLIILEKALGDDHPLLDTTLNFLALINQKQGNYTKASNYYRRIITIYKQTLIPDHPKQKNAEKQYDAIQIKIRQQKNKRKKS